MRKKKESRMSQGVWRESLEEWTCHLLMWCDCGKSRFGREYQGLSFGHATSEKIIRYSNEDGEQVYTSRSPKYK